MNLKALNPNVSSPLQNGDKLSVIVKNPFLNISVVKEETYEKMLNLKQKYKQMIPNTTLIPR